MSAGLLLPAARRSEPTCQASSEIPTVMPAVVEAWLEGRPKERRLCERRREQRTPLDTPLDAVPLSEDGETPVGPVFRVTGQDVSQSGIRIRHADPLPFDTVGISVPFGEERDSLWIVRLRWCRFTRDGMYESGGVILRAVKWNRKATATC